jgi:hypothetical protein
MITTNDINMTVVLDMTKLVKLIAIDGDRACVYDATIPNPMGIPGIQNVWVAVDRLNRPM